MYVLHYDNKTFTKKPAATQDLTDIVRICESLDNVDFITRPVEPDVPDEEMDLEKTRIFLENTTKHINLANLILAEKLPDIVRMVQDKSLISFISCVVVSPLKWADSTTEKFIKIVEQDIPVAISSCPQAGTTAPLSEVGELVQVNAEILSAVVLANLVKPGAKIFYRGIPITSNLHVDASPRWCQPDSIRRIALVSNMTDYYGIPCCGTAAVSDEKEPNPQCLSEKALSWVFETASGAQFINSALGMLDQVMTVSPEQYIIDNMVLTLIKRLFSRPTDMDLEETAHTAVKDGLSMFGIQMDGRMSEDISRRIKFILSRQEPYEEDYISKQVDLIKDAVNSGKSSTKYLKTSRKGLRKGWLYSGCRIEGTLSLHEVCRIKDEILDSGQK
jgi:trimethylamine--corrinoid protein Co-methyltransferase